MNTLRIILFALVFSNACFGLKPVSAADAPVEREVKNLAIRGEMDEGHAQLVINAQLKDPQLKQAKALHSLSLNHRLAIGREKISHTFEARFTIIQGEPEELVINLEGVGEVRQVKGELLRDWSVRQYADGKRSLVVRQIKAEKPLMERNYAITAETDLGEFPQNITPLVMFPAQDALYDGFVLIDPAAEIHLQIEKPVGITPVDSKYLPSSFRPIKTSADTETFAFRFQGSRYLLPMRIEQADPEAREVFLHHFNLEGQLSSEKGDFKLEAIARVKNSKGGTLELLSGNVALLKYEPIDGGRLKYQQGRYSLSFDKPGEYPVRIKFQAAVTHADAWHSVGFRTAPSSLQPMILRGLGTNSQLRFSGAARPEWTGNSIASYLPASGEVALSWKEARTEAGGKLFYGAEMLSQISVSPGLMRQSAIIDGKLMQGEMSQLVLIMRGQGEVTRVQGASVLSWTLNPVPGKSDRQLLIRFNQPQKEAFSLLVQMQTPLAAFPSGFDPIQLSPEGCTRFAGYLRIVNEGAVRLEVANANGLSQISPDQFPESDATKAIWRTQSTQRFAYRFSNAEYQLRIQADNVLPELAVSQILSYHLGENELTIEAEMELDIREAPLRELLITIPKGYALSRLSASELNDHFIKESADQPDAQLRLVYGQPISGRQLVQLRLERNKALGDTSWRLPKVEVNRAKSTRGHVGITADPGFRLTASSSENLTEIATAFYPKKLAGIQAAFRLSEPAWVAIMKVERLPQSIQADVFHLFSIGEGIAYGSSVMNYQISGAPVSAFKIALAEEYFNVEFISKDIRGWQKTTNGFEIQLHAPVSGSYTLLASYERPFKTQGETLSFTGARPLDAQIEQGHTVVVSAYQFQVNPVNVSAGLTALEPGEVPADYRLFFDAPVLAAFRYNARPFNLQLSLRPMTQGETLGQVAERAAFFSRISKEGQILTDAQYFVKNRGLPHFQIVLPEGAQLWSATVNSASTTPVVAGKTNMIPLPQRADPNAVHSVSLKLAAHSKNPALVTVTAPMAIAPVLLTEWKIVPDSNQRLVFKGGSLMPLGGVQDFSGYSQLSRIYFGDSRKYFQVRSLATLGLLIISIFIWHWAAQGPYRYSIRHLVGILLGVVALSIAVYAVVEMHQKVQSFRRFPPSDLTFLAPVQQSGAMLSAEVANFPAERSWSEHAGKAWPAFLALVVWAYGMIKWQGLLRSLGRMLGWTFAAWAVLRFPNSAQAFLVFIMLFLLLELVIPAVLRLGRLPGKPKAPAPPPTTAAPAAALLVAGLLGSAMTVAAQTNVLPVPKEEIGMAESIQQEIRVEESFIFAHAKLRWQALKGQKLPILQESGVLTKAVYSTNSLKWMLTSPNGKRANHLLALQDGVFDIEIQYQTHVSQKGSETGLTVPVPSGLVNQITLTLTNMDVDVLCPQAASVERTFKDKSTISSLNLAPGNAAWIAWKPRSRDTKLETALFYAEIYQLILPTPGSIEVEQWVQVRPAQGELNELVFDIPQGATVSDVLDPAFLTVQSSNRTAGAQPVRSIVSLWRFDPDIRKLRVNLNPAQSKPFSLVVKAQIPAASLPYERPVGLLSISGAASQIGLVGVASGSEVQLDSIVADPFSPINLEDFPGFFLQRFKAQVPGFNLRRAFRYASPKGDVLIKASAVDPDVRIEGQHTLSLGEDRILLASSLTVDITRAGIFQLSFLLPAGMDVESISGQALSHWTELKTAEGRAITLHLKGKTEGQQQFALSLTGPGIKATNDWLVPGLFVREASKQRGQLIVVPEQGMRLQVGKNDGVTLLDPQKAGIRQKGVLVFRFLADQIKISLNIEQVAPWIQVASLQHAIIGEAQVKVSANLSYQIENTGLKSLRVWLPSNADGVRFQGDQVSDFLLRDAPEKDGLKLWEIKLHRRAMVTYLLQASYQIPVAEKGPQIMRGVLVEGVSLQRGYLTLNASGRLQVRIGALPPELQPAEWQSIPRNLRQDIQDSSAHYTFRLVDAAYQLPVQVERHEAAKLLPARVNNITLTSVIADDGLMLTQVRMEIMPGDKRLLHLTLPPQARFWFAIVNQNGVWPWKEQDRFLIPLEASSKPGQAVVVEIFYSCKTGAAKSRILDLKMVGPQFDLPLENINWHVYLDEKWKIQKWSGTLQLASSPDGVSASVIDLNDYLQNEAGMRREKTKEADEFLQLGITYQQQGDPQLARRSFQTAFGLSTHDDAFNEDARVKLHNLKLEQALLGLNVRQAAQGGESSAVAAKLKELRANKSPAYTPQEAKEIIDRNSADENAALAKLAERLIQQQDAAVANPSTIRATVPQLGRQLLFSRTIQVDTWANLTIDLKAVEAKPAPYRMRVLLLAGLFLFFIVCAWAASFFRNQVNP